MPVQTITAEKAANLLKKNTRNRKLNKRAVSRYANLMKQGLWRIGNDAICIAPDGTLLKVADSREEHWWHSIKHEPIRTRRIYNFVRAPRYVQMQEHEDDTVSLVGLEAPSTQHR